MAFAKEARAQQLLAEQANDPGSEEVELSLAEIDQWLEWLDTPLDPALLAEVDAILAPFRDRPRHVGRPENND